MLEAKDCSGMCQNKKHHLQSGNQFPAWHSLEELVASELLTASYPLHTSIQQPWFLLHSKQKTNHVPLSLPYLTGLKSALDRQVQEAIGGEGI